MEKLNIPGWCSKEKKVFLTNIIKDRKPHILVEIGVFGGASLFQCALALHEIETTTTTEIDQKEKRQIFAIDAWDSKIAREGYNENHVNYKWWSNINLNDIYIQFLSNLSALKLENYVSIIKKPSNEANHEFVDQSIDFLHIHKEQAYKEIKIWLCKIKEKGIIILDDANSPDHNETEEELLKYTNCIFNHDHWQVYEKKNQ